MDLLLLIIQISSCITGAAAVIMLLVKPIREKILKTGRTLEGEKCLLRSEMLHIYYKYLDKKEIRQYEFENFIKLYEAYTSLGGNSFIREINEEVMTWKVIP